MKRIVRRLGLVLFVLVVLGATSLAGYLLGTTQAKPVEGQIVLSTISDEEWEKFVPLIQTFELIRDRFYFELPTDEELIEGAIQGMIDTLPGEGAQYTYYYNPLMAKINRSMMSGGFAGIGVRITSENGQAVISSIEPGGPAERAGIKAGDVIIAVDGESIEGLPWEIRSGLLRGEVGSTSTLTIFRIGAGRIDVEVTRDFVVTPSVRTRVLGDGHIGYISLEIFGDTATEEVREALRQLLDEEGVEAIILDLRGNPGGNQQAGLQILSQFLPGGKPAAQIYSSDGAYYTLATFPGGIALDVPLVLLIDQGSASASEMVAAAFKDYERATIIGDTSHGKGVGQTPISLPDGSLTMVVDHEFRSPMGTVIHEVGVQPDIRVPTSPAERQRGTDRALDRAIEVLLERLGGSAP
ncbi:hypothetical protein A2890_01195 [candidate division WWE3 bacterium RIFCSPLOWO2_01_FULL_53_14]|uniref:PDZ domain-containing protein n=1 Tax=candidate division WWE3 bacterium RIFCSPLOWO2_01_FULL_53_14 TaxID=1802628 RepID=A0A1F4VSR5_UNCKA|nr:MAG: hypothetical protein A2890_01195 [candidate division WWE3 bacterium RIFCSPLOWO2_01_FULL_53_14]